MFSTEHFIWLALCTALIVVGSILTAKYKLSMETVLTITCVCCVLSEVVKIFSVLIAEQRVVNGGIYIKESDLPFHLCSLQIFFAFVAKFTKSQKVRDFLLTFMIPTGIIGAFAALMLPTITCSFANVRSYQYFLYHASLIWMGIAILLRSGLKLDFKAYLKTLGTLLVIVWLTFYINGMFQNTNFLYLSKPPLDGLPILNLDNGWFVYFISYMALALVLITLFFAPFWITYAVKAKKNAEKSA